MDSDGSSGRSPPTVHKLQLCHAQHFKHPLPANHQQTTTRALCARRGTRQRSFKKPSRARQRSTSIPRERILVQQEDDQGPHTTHTSQVPRLPLETPPPPRPLPQHLNRSRDRQPHRPPLRLCCRPTHRLHHSKTTSSQASHLHCHPPAIRLTARPAGYPSPADPAPTCCKTLRRP